MYEMVKVLDPDKGVSCVFRQPGADSHCNQVHGYDLRFTITLGAQELNKNGWVFDFGRLKFLRQKIQYHFDHKWILGKDDPQFLTIMDLEKLGICSITVVERTGCEAFARMVYDWAEDMVAEAGQNYRVTVLSVTCSENGANHATYRHEAP